MKTNKAEVRLDEAFNEMPGRDVIEKRLNEVLGEKGWHAVDSDAAYWKNALDTLVFQIDAKASMGKGIEVGMLGSDLSADELHFDYNESGKIIMRLWWD